MTHSIASSDQHTKDFVIDVSNLTKRFGDKTVVNHLSLQIKRGEVFGFLGPNGSGKTTCIRMMCGLLTPDSGKGYTLGYDILKQTDAIKKEVGYMTQRFSLYEDLTIRENLEFIAGIYQMDRKRERVDKALERLGLESRANQYASGLSGGWKQRLSLAACLLHEPQLLLLDEPTAGVDPKARRDFWDEIHALAAQGLTALVSTHYMDEAQRCHRLGYIAYGQLLALGTPKQLVENSGLSTWHVLGDDLNQLIQILSSSKDIQMLTRFGDTLHISGTNKKSLEAAIAPFRDRADLQWSFAQTQLEDVFIHLMNNSQDNFKMNQKN